MRGGVGRIQTLHHPHAGKDAFHPRPRLRRQRTPQREHPWQRALPLIFLPIIFLPNLGLQANPKRENWQKHEGQKYGFQFPVSVFMLGHQQGMPITCPISFNRISQAEFAAIDYRVMHHAFACQNELGRLCDEVIYQNDLAARLVTDGLGPVRREVPVRVTHGDFSKTYYLDLVVGNGAVYELKTATQLIAEHEAQLLNYILLLGVGHAKLLNFRSAQVEHRFVNTSLTTVTQRQVTLDTCRWQEETDGSRQLRLVLAELLDDWGGFLQVHLYLEALIELFGGEDRVARTVPLTRKGLALGNQRLHLVEADTAFRITALPEQDAIEHERHLRSLLLHIPLRIIQWINLGRHRVQLVSLVK